MHNFDLYHPSSNPPMIDHEKQHFIFKSLTLSACATLVACGGGGDSNFTNVAEPTAVLGVAPVVAAAHEAIPAPLLVPVPLESPPAAPNAAIDVSCESNDVKGFQVELLHQINALRAVGAVCGTTIYRATGSLNWNNMLLKAAAAHSNDMASNNLFSHISSDGSTLPTRYAMAGYGFSAAGENIAAGQSTVEEVMRSWIKSPGHCQNLMNPTYREVAVACKRNDAATYGLYWTMDLGRQ